MRPFRPRRRGTPQSAGSALSSALKKLGLTDQARRLEIAAAWVEAVGPDVARRSEPQSFSRGVLVVRSSSAAWQNELTFLKGEIISRVNEALGSGLVRDLRVVGGAVRANSRQAVRPQWIDEPPSAEDVDAAKDAAQPIADDELRRSFERLVALDRRAQRARRAGGRT